MALRLAVFNVSRHFSATPTCRIVLQVLYVLSNLLFLNDLKQHNFSR